MKQILLLIALFFSLTVSAQQKPYLADPGAWRPTPNIDIHHMMLSVKFNPEKNQVMGDVVHTFTPTQRRIDSFFLNAPDIRFQTVEINGKSVKYSIIPTGIVIRPTKKLKAGKEYQLHLVYEATPSRGMYFIGWKDTLYGVKTLSEKGNNPTIVADRIRGGSLNPGSLIRRQIWTQGQAEDNRYWLPIDDNTNDKLTTDIKITFPMQNTTALRDKVSSKFRVLSNGKLIDSTDNGDGTMTWRFTMDKPHSSYLIMIGIGEYDVVHTQNANNNPLEYWYYPNQRSAVGPTYIYTPEIMNFFEKETGVPYQWVKYAQIPVQDFIYGAMENTTATVFGDFFYVTPRQFIDNNYVSVNAHEMAHQWFGDLITAKTYQDQWLQEGFATHYAKIAERSIFGEDYFQWNRRQEQVRALTASKTNVIPIRNTQAGSPRWYQKSSFVLDMLKDTVGHDNYNKVVIAYLNKYAHANVNSTDFANMFKEVLHLDVDWFFDEWIYRGGEPHYSVNYETAAQKSQVVTRVHITQTQDLDSFTNYFAMPIRVNVYYKDGTMDWNRQWVSTKEATIDVPNVSAKPIDFVLFDPGNHILKAVEFNKNMDELKSQALKAPEMLDRYDAVEGMKNYGYYLKRQFLGDLFAKNPYYPIQVEIIKQMAPDTNIISQKMILMALKDKDAVVRQEVFKNIQSIPESQRAAFEALLKDSSINVVQEALIKLSSLYPARIPVYLEQTMDKDMDGLANKLRITWLKLSYEQGNQEARTTLEDYLSPLFEFRTRINAMNALSEMDAWNSRSAYFLLQAAVSWNGRLAGPAQTIIKDLNGENKVIFRQAIKSNSWTDKEKTILSKLL